MTTAANSSHNAFPLSHAEKTDPVEHVEKTPGDSTTLEELHYVPSAGTKHFQPETDVEYVVTFKTWVVIFMLTVTGSVCYWLVPALSGIENQIAAELGDVTKGTWITAVYNLGAVVAFLVCGPNSDLFGRRWFIVFGNILVVVGGIVGGSIQWPLVDISTQVEMLRLLILRTAVEMDQVAATAQAEGKAPWMAIERQLGHKIGMCNYYANRPVCEAADRAIQIHGGGGYSRHYPFEHIWRHFRRYRITEGSEEMQIRKVAAYLFGYKTTGLKRGETSQKTKL
ncbi:acyl-CoA dehydrogenase [Penicillium chermesinum]|uniref:Acyl-CoA dehydrogenase n=1 Tax=Penicillium chermesinum TaxID=63820 RepID=A0A9W9PJS2_9EURO|nr:acyl-CoA dehydrogenase [Penicillium chermesinum]KAJ5246552.1 acyl-CoA dehydrogenase [Penicillium chermesinum]KAJ6144820.1 acyl-CoA dehydrogenase [Penicillium chermesinum]